MTFCITASQYKLLEKSKQDKDLSWEKKLWVYGVVWLFFKEKEPPLMQ